VNSANERAALLRLILILAVAFAVRTLFGIFLPAQHLPDAGAYRTAALEFRHLHLMANNDIMPLYPLFVAIVGDGWRQILADIILSVASVYLVYLITLRVYRDETVALIAALFCALWPHFVFFAVVGLTETLFITLILAAFVCLFDRRYALASVFLVLSILTRPSMELLAPLLIFYFSVVLHREAFRIGVRRIITYGLIYAALMAPWWAYNYARYGQFVRLDLAAGMVLYTGNNPMNVTGGGIAGKARDVDLGAFSNFADPVRRDEALRKAAVQYIKSDPLHFIAMMPVKFARLWQPWPHADEFKNPLIVIVSVVSAMHAFILALIGLALTLRRYFTALLPCLVYLAYITLVHVVTFGSVRYRVPMEPFVLMLAAAGLVELLRKLKVGRQLLSPLSSTR